MMQRVRYRNVAGEMTVYEYPPPAYLSAAARCLRALSRGTLKRTGKRWCVSARGRCYHNRTVEELIAKGQAVRDGDIVRRPA